MFSYFLRKKWGNLNDQEAQALLNQGYSKAQAYTEVTNRRTEYLEAKANISNVVANNSLSEKEKNDIENFIVTAEDYPAIVYDGMYSDLYDDEMELNLELVTLLDVLKNSLSAFAVASKLDSSIDMDYINAAARYTKDGGITDPSLKRPIRRSLAVLYNKSYVVLCSSDMIKRELGVALSKHCEQTTETPFFIEESQKETLKLSF